MPIGLDRLFLRSCEVRVAVLGFCYHNGLSLSFLGLSFGICLVVLHAQLRMVPFHKHHSIAS